MSKSIHKSAQIGNNVHIGHGVVIYANVQIGDDVQIGNHVVLHEETRIGNQVRIDDHAVLGKSPMRAAAIAIAQKEDLPPLSVGAETMIGTGAILYQGAKVGHKCLIADYASVRETSQIGNNTIIGRSAVIENQVTIGDRCKIETNVFIPAFSTLGNDCFIAPGVTFTNDNFMGRTEERKKHYKGVTIHDGGRIGANATILPGITIHSDGVAAAGALVTHDIQAQQIVAGIPAQKFRPVPKEQLLANHPTSS